MDQKDLIPFPVPTGEANYRHDPADTAEGSYFALSYRGKRVCIDSGLLHVLKKFEFRQMTETTRSDMDRDICLFLTDYSMKWWKHPLTGEFLELEALTVTFVKMNESDHVYQGVRSFSHMEVVLSPRYKVPNENLSVGSSPVHKHGATQAVQGIDPIP